MKKSMLKILLAVALGAVMLMPGVASSILMIDDFTSVNDPSGYWSLSPSATPVNTMNSVTKSETGLSNVLGGSRFTTASTIPFWGYYYIPSQWVNGQVSVDVWTAGTGFLFLSSGNFGTGALALKYDGGGSGLNADFANGTTITAKILSDHMGNGIATIMRLILTDAAGHSAAVTRTWNPPLSYSVGFNDYSFLLSNFTGVDLHHISSIDLYYQGDCANDLVIDSIFTDAPLPGTLMLLGSGLAGLASLGWRWRAGRVNRVDPL